MIASLGLNWAFRILSIIAFTINSSCIFLIHDRNTAIGINQGAFHITLFRRCKFQVLIGFGILTMLGYFTLIFSLADYAMSIGLNFPKALSLLPYSTLDKPLGGHWWAISVIALDG
jgi:hypothetical protein